MINVIKIKLKRNGMVNLNNQVIGRDNENLQSMFKFEFEDELIEGQARLEYSIDGAKYWVLMERDEEGYVLPIKNVLTKEGQIDMQVVIDEPSVDDEIPTYKSNTFYLFCTKSLNAVNEAPDGYELWLTQANEKLNEMDAALEETDNLDIDVSKTGSVSTITITNKEGTTKSVEVYDGGSGAIDYNVLEGKPSINNVELSGNKTTNDLGLFSGNYNDLTNRPTIPNNSDFTLSGLSEKDYNNLTNKPNIPTKTSDLTNDSGFINSSYHDSTKQNINDNNLTTTSKTIIDGINEVNSLAKQCNKAKGYTNYQTLIDELNNGSVGKNIYEGSQDFGGSWNNSYLWETDSNTYNNLVVKKRAESWNGINKAISIKANTTYTFSLYAKADSPKNLIIYLSGGTIPSSSISTEHAEISLTNEWNRYSITFSSTEAGTIKPRVENDSSTSNYTYICGYQLEEGSSMTSYEPYELTNDYPVGQSFLIQTLNVPDLWIMSKETISQTYTYTTDEAFITATSVNGGCQVGYYKLGQLETLKQDLTNYVQNTDYATNNSAGVVKINTAYGLNVSGSGSVYGIDGSYSDYGNAGDSYIISKGTLENVITGKGIVSSPSATTITQLTQAQYNALATKDSKTLYIIVG